MELYISPNIMCWCTYPLDIQVPMPWGTNRKTASQISSQEFKNAEIFLISQYGVTSVVSYIYDDPITRRTWFAE
eukprot:15102479-Ditylum_brightwellii.AAC.1